MQGTCDSLKHVTPGSGPYPSEHFLNPRNVFSVVKLFCQCCHLPRLHPHFQVRCQIQCSVFRWLHKKLQLIVLLIFSARSGRRLHINKPRILTQQMKANEKQIHTSVSMAAIVCR